MIIYNNNFDNYTDDKQPYSVISEAVHRYPDYDGFVKNNTFYFKRIMTKHLLEMPDVANFNLKLKLSYLPPAELAYFKKLAWGIYFGYDRKFRVGNELVIEYCHSEKTLCFILMKVCGVNKSELDRKTFETKELIQSVQYDAEISYNNGRLDISFHTVKASFECESKSGIIALTRECGVGETGFSDIIIDADSVDTENIYNQCFIIPRTDGGVLDYRLNISINRFLQKSKLYEINYELSGGVREGNPDFRGLDCWVGDADIFNGLYFSLGNKKYYLKNDKLTFTDPLFPMLKELLNGSDIPFKGRFTTSCLEHFKSVFIGYNRRFSENSGNLTSDRMFTYNRDGKLMFIGKELKEDCFFEVKSSNTKEITKRIPKDLPDYSNFLLNAQTNHYFFTDEIPEFYIDVYTKADAEFLKFDAVLENVWFEKEKPLELVKIDSGYNVFSESGYTKHSFSVKCDNLEQGVYHTRLICGYGSNKVYEHASAFEVLDDSKEESPQDSSNLPMIYCGDGIRSNYTTFDFAHVKPDFNIMHYINTSLDGPITAERRKIWEILKIYHRKLIIWMTFRTLPTRDETYHDHLEAIKHADYLNYIYPGIEDSKNYYRYDLWLPHNFDSAFVRKVYNDFLAENSDLKDIFPAVDGNGNVDLTKWGKLSGNSFDRWITYINSKTAPLFEKQWKEIQKINPSVKRFSYGPYHLYAINNSGAYNAKWFGYSSDGLAKIYDGGFMQFEDYPFICNYQTHISAWNMATIKLEWKNVKFAPELYDSFATGCPDGWVAHAMPPLGEYHACPYQTITQLYEYLYNTGIFDSGKFRYWNDNILQMYDNTSLEPEKRYRLLLKAWKIYLDNKPKKTLSPIAYIPDYIASDDRRTNKIAAGALYNMSQTGLSIVHEVNAEMGYPQGFVLKFESLDQLSDIGLLVLPSLRNTNDKTKLKIRQLYNSGTALIAAGDISGLEDIFGVEPHSTKEKCYKISYNEKEENIYPYTCEFFYKSIGAETVVSTESNAVIYKNNRAMLINASLGEVGVDSFMPTSNEERANISKLIREAINDFVKSAVNPSVCADGNCGVTLISTERGETLLILTDYSPNTNTESKTINVNFSGIAISDIQNAVYDEHNIELNIFKVNGLIKGFSTKIRHHEVLIFKLCR